MKLRNILSIIILCILTIVCFSSVLAMPAPDYYGKYDFFPLQITTTYDIYDTGEEVLFHINTEIGEVSKELSMNWTFQFYSEEYPIKDLVAYQYANKSYIKIPLEKDGKEYSFDFIKRMSGLTLFGSLEKSQGELDITKLPMVIHPTKSDTKIIIHKEGEILEYDFKEHGGFYKYNFQQQADYFKNIVNNKPEKLDTGDHFLGVISLNQPSWLSADILTVQGYDESLQEFVDSVSGGKYLYSDINHSQMDQIRKERVIKKLILGVIICIFILGIIGYFLVKKFKK